VSDLSVSFWSVLLPTVVGFAVCAGVVLYAVGRSFLSDPVSGVEQMIGSLGTATTALSLEGKVFIHGEYWTADADEEISAGDGVEVTAVEGLRLRVRRAPPS
jgi:membrane-bound serine protease (ClpP class)